MIFTYRILTFFLFPFLIIITYLRRFFNKEDKIRFKEKISVNESFYPKNKKIIWIHAASIGETNSVIPLIIELIKNDDKNFVLLTSTTLSSSQLILKKKIAQTNFQHRFFPLDVFFLVKKFLNHWKPELAIFVDSEVWPNYLIEISKRKIPLILLNGRITMKTFNRWKMFPKFSRKIFNLYNLCLTSSKESENNLKSLGATNVKFLGNIKFCSKISVKKDYSNLNLIFKDYFIWCAASTHPGEEKIILKTHSLLKQKGYKILTIIIPRHVNRTKKISNLSNSFKLESKIINKFDEISEKCEILIINSFGEMINYFHICKSIFMGKSLSKKLIKVGGQNPIEPAKCGCKIYHGPFISNFKEIYNFLSKKNIAYQIDNEVDLSQNLIRDLNDKGIFNEKNLLELNDYGEQILKLTVKEVLKQKNEI